MCATSAVMDYGQRDIWPNWPPRYVQPTPPIFYPNTPPVIYPQPLPAVPVETPEQKLREFLKLYEAAKEFDKKTAQPECEDPLKMQVLDRILERLDEIEKRLSGPAA